MQHVRMRGPGVVGESEERQEALNPLALFVLMIDSSLGAL